MEFKGTVKKVLPVQSGTSQSGRAWSRQTIIVEDDDPRYPQTVAMDVTGVNIGTVQVGDRVTALIEISSREYNEKWYTSVKAWKIEAEKPQGYVPNNPSEGGAAFGYREPQQSAGNTAGGFAPQQPQ